MAAATTRVPTAVVKWGDDVIKRSPADALATYYPGQLICVNATTALAVDATDATGIRFDGIVANSVNVQVLTTGSSENLDASRAIFIQRPFRIACATNFSAAASDIGAAVYVIDNQTVGKTSSHSVLVGYIDQILSASSVLIIPIYSPLNPVAVSNNTLAFTGTTGQNQITMPDNTADALSIAEGSNEYITFITTNSGETIALKENTTLAGTLTITSTSANAFDVGPNGATHPTFQIDASTSSATTGFKITSAAGTGGATLAIISDQTNESGTINAKGSGTLTLNAQASGGNVVVSSALAFGTDASAAKSIIAGTTNGLKIGTATTQKLGFYNATPVVQPAANTDTSTGAAGSSTAVYLNTTFTGSGGTAAYTIGGLITALKALGLLAA